MSDSLKKQFTSLKKHRSPDKFEFVGLSIDKPTIFNNPKSTSDHQKLFKNKIPEDSREKKNSINEIRMILKLRPHEKDMILFHIGGLFQSQINFENRIQDNIIYMLSNLPVHSINGKVLNEKTSHESYLEIDHYQRMLLIEQLLCYHLLANENRIDTLIKLRLKLGSFKEDLYSILKNLKFVEINNHQTTSVVNSSKTSAAMQINPTELLTQNYLSYYNPTMISLWNYPHNYPHNYPVNLSYNPIQPMYNPYTVNQSINQQPTNSMSSLHQMIQPNLFQMNQPIGPIANQSGQLLPWNRVVMPAMNTSNSQKFYDLNALMNGGKMMNSNHSSD